MTRFISQVQIYELEEHQIETWRGKQEMCMMTVIKIALTPYIICMWLLVEMSDHNKSSLYFQSSTCKRLSSH